MIYIKIHDSENGNIVAMCDHTLIDKVLKEGELEINLKDYSEFYKGQLVEIDKAVEMLNPAKLYSANVVGKESVKAAIAGEIIDKDGVKFVGKIPYANAFRIKY
jgi:uncharacterized protein